MFISSKQHAPIGDARLTSFWRLLGKQLLPFSWLLVGIGLAASLQYASASSIAESGFTRHLERAAIALSSDSLFLPEQSRVKASQKTDNQPRYWSDFILNDFPSLVCLTSVLAYQFSSFYFSSFLFFTPQNPRAPPVI